MFLKEDSKAEVPKGYLPSFGVLLFQLTLVFLHARQSWLVGHLVSGGLTPDHVVAQESTVWKETAEDCCQEASRGVGPVCHRLGRERGLDFSGLCEVPSNWLLKGGCTGCGAEHFLRFCPILIIFYFVLFPFHFILKCNVHQRKHTFHTYTVWWIFPTWSQSHSRHPEFFSKTIAAPQKAFLPPSFISCLPPLPRSPHYPHLSLREYSLLGCGLGSEIGVQEIS